jgi:hypothetical protein
MVTGALMAIIAATLLRMSMLRYQMGGRGAKILAEKRDDQGALANVLATWNAANAVCGGAPPGWAGCNNPGNCNCVCSSGGAAPVTVTASLVGGSCQLNLTSTDLP